MGPVPRVTPGGPPSALPPLSLRKTISVLSSRPRSFSPADQPADAAVEAFDHGRIDRHDLVEALFAVRRAACPRRANRRAAARAASADRRCPSRSAARDAPRAACPSPAYTCRDTGRSRPPARAAGNAPRLAQCRGRTASAPPRASSMNFRPQSVNRSVEYQSLPSSGESLRISRPLR